MQDLHGIFAFKVDMDGYCFLSAGVMYGRLSLVCNVVHSDLPEIFSMQVTQKIYSRVRPACILLHCQLCYSKGPTVE